MRGMKDQLLGIGIILCGIAFSMNNFFGYIGGIFGMAVVVAGYLSKENNS